MDRPENGRADHYCGRELFKERLCTVYHSIKALDDYQWKKGIDAI